MVPTDRLYLRRFLNRPRLHGTGYVLAQVSDTTGATGSYIEPEVRFELGDCSRHISLDFPVWTERDRRNSLAKARLLADVTARFADALEQEAELARVRIRERRARRSTPGVLVDWMVHVSTRGARGSPREEVDPRRSGRLDGARLDARPG